VRFSYLVGVRRIWGRIGDSVVIDNRLLGENAKSLGLLFIRSSWPNSTKWELSVNAVHFRFSGPFGLISPRLNKAKTSPPAKNHEYQKSQPFSRTTAGLCSEF
jgi:hypothetical protein